VPQPSRPDSRDPDADAVTPVTARAHAFVEDLAAPELSPGDHHHLARVLRLEPGSLVTVGDGAGRWRAGRLTGAHAVEAAADIRVDAPPRPPITVAFALVKADRPELTVQKLTEVGVDRIVPFVAERSVVRWDAAKVARQADRFAEIARHAAMQCRRTQLPRVDAVASFDQVAALDGATLADPDGDPPTLARPVALVGPEGGWSTREREVDLPRTRIGENVLRAETASIAIGVLLVSLRSELVSIAGRTRAKGGQDTM
jgi:16S rRNA (uracil1498-N3)-methyltransferase